MCSSCHGGLSEDPAPKNLRWLPEIPACVQPEGHSYRFGCVVAALTQYFSRLSHVRTYTLCVTHIGFRDLGTQASVPGSGRRTTFVADLVCVRP